MNPQKGLSVILLSNYSPFKVFQYLFIELPIATHLHEFDQTLRAKEILWNCSIDLTIIIREAIIFDGLLGIYDSIIVGENNTLSFDFSGWSSTPATPQVSLSVVSH